MGSLYFEQSFVSLHDGFVRAVALCKNTVVGGSVVQMLAGLGVQHVPEMPKEVELWFASQEISSSRLRSNKKEETNVINKMMMMPGESTVERVPKNIITKENALNGSYLNNSDCISSTTSQQENHVEDSINLSIISKTFQQEIQPNHVEDSLNLVRPGVQLRLKCLLPLPPQPLLAKLRSPRMHEGQTQDSTQI